MLTFPIRSTFAVALFLLIAQIPVVAEEVDLGRLIEKLAETEKLFSGDLDVEYTTVSDSKLDPFDEFQKHKKSTAFYPVHKEGTSTYVAQEDRLYSSTLLSEYFFESTAINKEKPAPLKETCFKSMFNGKETTSVIETERGPFVFTFSQRSTDLANTNFPFDIVLGDPVLSEKPLSEQIQAYRKKKPEEFELEGVKFSQSSTVTVEELNTQDFPNHIKLTLETNTESNSADNGFVDSRYVIYLNKNKHLLPERCEVYQRWFGPAFPLTMVTNVAEWGQSPEGTWYPKQIKQQKPDMSGDDTNDDTQNDWESQSVVTVKKCSFSPDYDDDFFNQVNIPEGARVYKDGVQTTGTK